MAASFGSPESMHGSQLGIWSAPTRRGCLGLTESTGYEALQCDAEQLLLCLCVHDVVVDDVQPVSPCVGAEQQPAQCNF